MSILYITIFPFILIINIVSGNIDCMTRISIKSGTANDANVVVECNSDETLVSCGIRSHNVAEQYIDGVSVQTNNDKNQCVAVNGHYGDGVYALARCCIFSHTTLSCNGQRGTTVSYAGSKSIVQCPLSQPYLLGCSARSGYHSIAGSYPGTDSPETRVYSVDYPVTSRNCTMVIAAGDSNDVGFATAMCCESAEYQITCIKRFGAPNAPLSSIGCVNGFFLSGCSGLSDSWTWNLNAWYIENDYCYARSRDNNNVWATAICCKIGTDEPTISPTLQPTKYPTIIPTFNPTIPTATPTNQPSLIPTNAPTSLPTPSPTITPTSAPTDNPTPSPTINPTATPSLPPTYNPSIYPSNAPSISPSNIPSISPSFAPTIPPTEFPSKSPSTPSPTLFAVKTLSPTTGPTEKTERATVTTIFDDENGRKSFDDIGTNIIILIITGVTVCLLIIIIIFIIYYYRKKGKNVNNKFIGDKNQTLSSLDTNININNNNKMTLEPVQSVSINNSPQTNNKPVIELITPMHITLGDHNANNNNNNNNNNGEYAEDDNNKSIQKNEDENESEDDDDEGLWDTPTKTTTAQ